MIAWGLGGAAYGLLVAFRMELAGATRDGLLLMVYVAVAFALLGGVLYSLRAAIRALLAGFSRRKHAGQGTTRSLAACVIASLGGVALCLALLTVAGDWLLTTSFRPDVGGGWLIARNVLVLACGAVALWLLAGPLARRVDGFLAQVRYLSGAVTLALVCACLLGVAFLAPHCGAPTRRSARIASAASRAQDIVETGLKVLVFGVDGATWTVYGPLIEEDELPTTAELVSGGASAVLHSLPPQVSPAIWTTIVTGQPAKVHGVQEYLLVSLPGLAEFPFEALAKDRLVIPFFFVGLGYYLAGLAEGIPPTSDQVRVKSLWHLLGEGGDRSLVLGWPCTWPARELAGLMVSDRFGPGEFDMFSRPGSRLEELVFPSESEERLRALSVESGGDPRPMLDAVADLEEEDIELLKNFFHNPMLPRPLGLLEDVYDADMSFLNIMLEELGKSEFDLGLVMINGVDLTMHVFWREKFPADFGLQEAEHPRWGQIIDGYHRLVDKRMGEILRTAGDGTVVIMLSDHGMQADPDNLIWPGWHAEDALLIMAGGPVRKGVKAEGVSYLDFAPTILYLLGYGIPADMPGRVLTELLEDDFLQRFPVRRTSPAYGH